jgi:hypothetical protein
VTIGLGPNGTGKLRLVRPGVLLHFCEACGCGHTIDVHAQNRDGKVLGWDGDVDRPSIAEAVRHEAAGAVCEYVLKAGVLYYLQSCSHALAGQTRHLIEYPLNHLNATKGTCT